MIHHFVHVRVQRAPDGTWLWIRGESEADFDDEGGSPLPDAFARTATRWEQGECRSALNAAREAGASYEGRVAALLADGEDA